MWIFAIVLICAALLVWFLYDGTNRLQVTRTEVAVALETPLTLVHLSDLHAKQFGPGNAALYETIERQRPDLICFTGDLFNRSLEGDCEATLEFMVRLTRLAPVVFIYGNHDVGCGLEDYMEQRLTDGGVHVLCNEMLTLELRGQTVSLLGLQELGVRAEDIPALVGTLEQADGLRVLLSHYPENFSLKSAYDYKQYDIDLVLSGHAHGGQFILPLLGGLYAPGQGVLPKYYSGLYVENGVSLVVNRGLGGIGFPFRLFNRPEVGVLTLGAKTA